jgi:DNA recombination protein RmuC
MADLFPLIATVLLVFLLIMLVAIMYRLRKASGNSGQVTNQLDCLGKELERVERCLRDEFLNGRQEAKQDARSQRDETTTALKNSSDSLFNVVSETAGSQKLELAAFGQSLQTQVSGLVSIVSSQLQTFSVQLTNLTKTNEEKLEQLRSTVDTRLVSLHRDSGAQLNQIREATRQDSRLQSEQLSTALNAFNESTVSGLRDMSESQRTQSQSLSESVDTRLKQLQSDTAARLDQMREETKQESRFQREEVNTVLKNLNDSLLNGLREMSESQLAQSRTLRDSMETRFSVLRDSVDAKLKEIQDNNSQKLEEMRLTVDEKLHGTLEKRLGEAFSLVTGQLEQVHKGLGEMQTLATGVGDLKRALTNVKTRGGWSEIQLGALLEDMLAPTQYDRNFKPRETGEAVVEYAIKLPNRDGSGEPVWLPIDAKFPIETYNRLVDAQERADVDAINTETKALEIRIKGCAKEICEKYLNPPRTTDFGIMFLPTEGLYAEVIRRAALVETVRRDYNVTIVGPSTLSAFINSLQMGFRTLAIQERSSEVWKLLGAVKTQFGKFGDVLEGVRKKLEQATSSMDSAAVRTRVIERKLRAVEELPATEALVLLGAVDLHEEAEEPEAVLVESAAN